jgi:hypothetical protein
MTTSLTCCKSIRRHEPTPAATRCLRAPLPDEPVSHVCCASALRSHAALGVHPLPALAPEVSAPARRAVRALSAASADERRSGVNARYGANHAYTNSRVIMTSDRFYRIRAGSTRYSTRKRQTELYRSARRAGIIVRSSVECLLATCAVRDGLEVRHRDRDFNELERVSPLRAAGYEASFSRIPSHSRNSH